MMQPTALATSEFSLSIKNLNQTTANLSLDDLLALPKTTVGAALYCYGNLVAGGYWSGIKLTDLFSQVGGIEAEVRSFDLKAEDGYRVGIPLETAMRPDVIIAYEKDGTPLPEKLRLVIPDANGDVWIAQISSIEMSTQELGASVSAGSAMAPLDSMRSNLGQQPTMPPPASTSKPEFNDSVEPVIPSTNTTQTESEPENKATEPPNTEVAAWTFTVEMGYVLVIALISAVSISVLVIFWKKKR